MPKLPAATQLDSAYFDFIEGLKLHNYAHVVPQVLARYRNHKVGGATFEDAGVLIDSDLLYRFAGGIQRASQEMAWRSARDSIAPHRSTISAWLEQPRPDPLGRLELDPEFVTPAWYLDANDAAVDDIHLQPYWGDDLVGAIYERGGALYRTAWRAGYVQGPNALVTFAASAPDSQYRRILDLGCSFGSLTLALRATYPEADEVVGIDVSAAALRWAALLAEEARATVTYAQRDASCTGYDSESFDLIAGFLVCHEMPSHILDETLDEAHRLLRPGGHLMFLDVPRYAVLEPEVAYIQSFDQYGNGERFWDEFLQRDLPSDLRRRGFVDVSEGPLDHPDEAYWGSAALMRTGAADARHRWATHATKPLLSGAR